MNKLFVLFKILFNSMYGISYLRYKTLKSKRELFKALGIGIVILMSTLPILIGYIAFLVGSYNSYEPMGQPGAIITLGTVSASSIVLVFGFFLVLSTFYFSKDTEHLLSIPLKPSQILGAKFGIVLTGEYLTELPLMLPPIIIYGVKSGAGFVYCLYSLIAVLTIPVIPLCIVSVLALLVMKMTNAGKKKDLYTLIGTITAILLIVGIQMYLQSTAISGGEERINEILLSKNGIVSIISRSFPPAEWISIGLISYYSLEGLGSMFLFIGVTILSVTLFGYLSSKLFLKGYIGSQEYSSERKNLSEEQFEKATITRSKVMAVALREFKITNRIIPFLINCTLVSILMPAIFVVMFFTTGRTMSQEILSMVQGAEGVYTGTLIAAGFGILTSASSMTAPTSISREGALFFISKYIPVSPEDQVRGKLLHAFILSALGNILTISVMGVILKLPVQDIIMGSLFSTTAVLPMIVIGLIIDLFKPLLVWDNPEKAVKRNLNGVVSMLLNAFWAIGTVYLAYSIIPGKYAVYTVLTVFYASLGIILYRVLLLYAKKRYAEIEI